MEIRDAVADEPSNLKGQRGAEYVMIAPRALLESAHRLADYRGAQGLSTLVADVEDVYDEFSGGVRTPEALRAFIAYGHREWNTPVRYVVLVGEGSIDYRDVTGSGDSLIPPVLVDTAYGLFPSDGVLGDTDGDGVPDVAVGRLPVLVPGEVDAIAGKIGVFEGSVSTGALLLSDDGDSGGDFPVDSLALGQGFPSWYGVEQVSLGTYTTAEARGLLFGYLGSGVKYLNYIGHGGVQRLADEGLLTAADVPNLTNELAPLLTAETCMVGHFGLPGYDSLSELLLVQERGGTVAVWSATGMSMNSTAAYLGGKLYEGVFGGGAGTVGAAMLEAYGALAAQGGAASSALRIYNLQGDPATRVE